MSDQEKVEIEEGSAPLTHVVENEEGDGCVVPDVETIADECTNGETQAGENMPEKWPWPNNEQGMWIEINDHGNATAWVPVIATRIARGEQIPSEKFPRLGWEFEMKLRVQEPEYACPGSEHHTDWRGWSDAERKIAAMRRLCAQVGCTRDNDAAITKADLEDNTDMETREQIIDQWWDEYTERLKRDVHPNTCMEVDKDTLKLSLRNNEGEALAIRKHNETIPQQNVWSEHIDGRTVHVEQIGAAIPAWELV